MIVNRIPPMPVYDPKTDGNVFAWIIAMAPKVRAERAAITVVTNCYNRVRRVFPQP